MKRFNTRKPNTPKAGIITASAIALILVGANYGFDRKPSEFDSIVARSKQVFRFDDAHRNALPSNQVIALSMAIKFQNEEGARALLASLENQMAQMPR